MAFSAEEKTKILYYLGYSIFEDDGPAMRAIHSLDSKEASGGFIIRDILSKLERIECEIMETVPLASAIKDGSVELRAHYTLDHVWRIGKSYVARLANFTKVAIFADIFSVGSIARNASEFYSGDPSEHRLDDRGVVTR